MDTTRSLMEKFRRLRAMWQAAHPRGGAVAALAGFDFQLAAALVEVIRRFDPVKFERGDDRYHANVFMEALSDTAVHDNGLVIITQAKRSLHSGALKDALDDLWSIDQFVRARMPELVDRLRYSIVTRRIVLKDWEAARERWAPDGQANSKHASAFSQSISCKVTADPWLEAAALLTTTFKVEGPFGKVSNFIGELVGSAELDGSLDGAIARITTSLFGSLDAATRRTVEIHPWRSTDKPPATVNPESDIGQAVRIGENLTIGDLRAGRLADRAVYKEIHAECEAWLARLSATSNKIPIFWVEGRSGTGKSAALLHLLAKLHDENPSRALLWLGPHSEAVARAVAWSADFMRHGYQVVIAMDDPASGQRAEEFASAVRRAREERDIVVDAELEAGRTPPEPLAIICCGPTEQREDAVDVCGDEIEIYGFPLRKETQADLDELADFFRIRTGREPPPLGGDVLLVQRFFEWEKGEISDFARNFRTRLRDFDRGRPQEKTFEAVAKILAFGRLYIDYPASEADR